MSVRRAAHGFARCAWAFLAAIVLAGGLSAPAPASAQTPAAGPLAKLVVGTMRVPPFAMRGDDGVWSGLSIELWRQVAAEMKIDFEFREYDYDADGMLNAVETGQIDLAVAAVPVTPEGEVRFDFSHAYFGAGLGIAVRAEPQTGALSVLGGLLTAQFFGAIAALLCGLVLAGALVWLAERRHNQKHFDPRPLHGVGDGVWWAAVTMTTTGYGDKTPVTWRGRTIGLVWMFMSIFGIAMFSATLASSFVVSKLRTGIAGPGDLPNARIATVAGSASEQWLGQQGLSARTYAFVIQASKALQRGDVQALVFDRAILGHMIKEYGWKDLLILPQTLAVRDYALVFPAGSRLKEDANRALLAVTHRGAWKGVVLRYVGASEP